MYIVYVYNLCFCLNFHKQIFPTLAHLLFSEQNHTHLNDYKIEKFAANRLMKCNLYLFRMSVAKNVMKY